MNRLAASASYPPIPRSTSPKPPFFRMKPPTGGAGGSGFGAAQTPRGAGDPAGAGALALGTPGVGTPGGGHGVLVSTLASSGGRFPSRRFAAHDSGSPPKRSSASAKNPSPWSGKIARTRDMAAANAGSGPDPDPVDPKETPADASRFEPARRCWSIPGGSERRRLVASSARVVASAAAATTAPPSPTPDKSGVVSCAARSIASKSAPGAACRGSIPRALGSRVGFTFEPSASSDTITALPLRSRRWFFSSPNRPGSTSSASAPPRRSASAKGGWARTNAARLTATS